MAVRYKQKCFRCKKNYVSASWKNRYVMCYECQKGELATPITNPKMKKMFNIPEEFYVKSAFLRDIKSRWIKFNALSEKQIEAFKETVKQLKNPNTEEDIGSFIPPVKKKKKTTKKIVSSKNKL